MLVPCDVTNAAQCEQAARRPATHYGRIDILVNVAGGSGPIGKSGVETTPQEFDDIVAAQHERVLPRHARRAADHDRAALRQDRQCGRHLRHARARGAHGLFGVEMGIARIDQELRARARRLQHQRELRCARHGRRSAVPRQGLRRYGKASRHQHRRGRRAPCRGLRASSASPRYRRRQCLLCFSPATSRVRSPASTCRSTAVGRCYEQPC